MIYTQFYDQVLTEIEAGNVHDGINLLVGMLDTVGLQGGSLKQASRELRGHSLSRMLLEDPLIAHARATPDASADRVRMIAEMALQDDISSTGRRLFAATSELSFARAVRQRWGSFDLKLSRAQRDGLSICMLGGCGGTLLDGISGTDVAAIEVDEALFRLQSIAATHQRFDLILAPDLLDRKSTSALTDILTLMGKCLSAQGCLVVAGLLPGHLGSGWRSACLNWDPQCYDEITLLALAAAAGLSARTYRDETNCIVWAELKKSSCTSVTGSACHAN